MKVLLRETKLMLSLKREQVASLVDLGINQYIEALQTGASNSWAISGKHTASESQSLLMTLICKRLFQANGTSSTSSTETKQVKISL